MESVIHLLSVVHSISSGRKRKRTREGGRKRGRSKRQIEQYAPEEAVDRGGEEGGEDVSQVEHHLIYDIKNSSARLSRALEEPQPANFVSPCAESPDGEASKTFDSSDGTYIFGDPKPSYFPGPRTLATPKPVTTWHVQYLSPGPSRLLHLPLGLQLRLPLFMLPPET